MPQVMVLAPKMTVSGEKTNISRTFFQRDRKDTLARAQSQWTCSKILWGPNCS